MAENETQQVTQRDLREAELQMTGRPPAAATGFIRCVAARPVPGHCPTQSGEQPADSHGHQQ